MKNKRVFCAFVSLFVFLLFLSGCSQEAKPSKQEITSNNGAPRNGGQRMPDFGQPERAPDIRGIVKSIVGNEATILKVDMRGGQHDQKASSTETINNSARTAPAISLNSGGAQGGAPGRGFGGRPGDDNNPTDREAMLAKLKEMSTGEEKILIPVGIQMLKSSIEADAGKRTMVEATVSDITADKTITIWLNSSAMDRKIAEFVLIN